MAVAYTITAADKTAAGKDRIVATIAYTAEPYSSGVALDRLQLGMPVVLESLNIIDDGFVSAATEVKFDSTNSKLRIFVETAGTFAETSGNQTFTCKVEALGW